MAKAANRLKTAAAPAKTEEPKKAPTITTTATTAAAAVAAAPSTTETQPEYTMTANDRAELAMFENAAKTYERSSHDFAKAAYRMKANGLHTRAGHGDFGAFCAATFARLGLKHIEARQAANLATVGECLAAHPDCAALQSLPSTAILRLSEKLDDIRDQCEEVEDIADAAERLKDYMEDTKSRDAARAAIDLATFGPEGDQRTKEEKRADAIGEAEEKIRTAAERLVRTDRKRFDALVDMLTKDFNARVAKTMKKGKKTKRN